MLIMAVAIIDLPQSRIHDNCFLLFKPADLFEEINQIAMAVTQYDGMSGFMRCGGTSALCLGRSPGGMVQLMHALGCARMAKTCRYAGTDSGPSKL